MFTTRRRLICGLTASGMASFSSPARAQTTAPIRIVFPFPPGGGADTLLRYIAEKLRTKSGRSVIVENISGAGGKIGLMAAKAAPPTANTLLFTSGAQMFLQPHLARRVGYDPFEDFIPLIGVAGFQQAIAIAGTDPATSIKDVLEVAQRDRVGTTFGTPGPGTLAHFVGWQLGVLSNVEFRHVPYRGAVAAFPDLVSGRLKMIISSVGELLEQHNSGRIRIIATAGNIRSEPIKEVATLREAGFDIQAPGYFAFYAIAGTPREETQPLATALREVLESAEFIERRRQIGLEGAPEGDFALLERREFNRWSEIVINLRYPLQD